MLQVNKVVSKSPPRRLEWLDILRFSAVVLVLWDHMVGEFLIAHKSDWFLNSFLNSILFEPLAIRQSGGFLGVCIFFLISGYIIAQVIYKESGLQFAVRRVIRIFPLLFIVSLTVWMLARMGVPGMPADALKASLIDLIKNSFLVNWVCHPQITLVTPAWTLVIEVSFYIIAITMLPFLKRSILPPVFLPISLLATTCISIFWSRSLGNNFFLFSVSLAYLPILAVGSLFYLYESKAISFRFVVFGVLLSWIIFLKATFNIYPQFIAISIDSYPISVVFAFFTFGFCYVIRNKLRSPRIITWIALSSYSIYLWHGVIALPLQGILLPFLGFPFSLIISLIMLILISTISYNYIEKPCLRFAKKLI